MAHTNPPGKHNEPGVDPETRGTTGRLHQPSNAQTGAQLPRKRSVPAAPALGESKQHFLGVCWEQKHQKYCVLLKPGSRGPLEAWLTPAPG